jgi:hypothetical protein
MRPAEPDIFTPGEEEALVDGLRRERGRRISRLNVGAGVAAGALLLFLACCLLGAVDESWHRALPLPELSMFVVAILYLIALAAGREGFRCYELSRMLKLADTVKARHGSLSDAGTQFLLAVEKRRLGWTGFCLSGAVMILGMATTVSPGMLRLLWPNVEPNLNVFLCIGILGLATAVFGMVLMVVCAFRGLWRLP